MRFAESGFRTAVSVRGSLPGSLRRGMRADKFAIVLRVHYFCREPKKTQDYENETVYEGENETYIDVSVENSGSVLYDKEIRNKPRTRRTKRNV